MTADSKEGDKNHSESSVTQNCSFQGFIVFKNTYAMRKGFSHISLIFPDRLISSQYIFHETQNIRARKDLSDNLVQHSHFMNTRNKALI